jgi:hypothetical protein
MASRNGRVYEYLHILTLTIHGGEWSVSHVEQHTSSLRTRATHWIGEWVNPRVGLDVVTNRKIPNPSQTELNHSVSSQLLNLQSYPSL